MIHDTHATWADASVSAQVGTGTQAAADAARKAYYDEGERLREKLPFAITVGVRGYVSSGRIDVAEHAIPKAAVSFELPNGSKFERPAKAALCNSKLSVEAGNLTVTARRKVSCYNCLAIEERIVAYAEAAKE